MTGEQTVLKGNIWTPAGFKPGRLVVQDGRVAAVEFSEQAPAPDAPYITPGLIDLQLNGALGYDFTAQPGTVDRVAEALPRWGVTAFLPTYITAPLEVYHDALGYLATREGGSGARIAGAHLEGPYLNPSFRGAHDPNFVREPSLGEIKALLEIKKDGRPVLNLMTLAPEEPGALPVIRLLNEAGVLVSAGHSGATYEEGLAAFEAGAKCSTHLFNAMPPLHHRQPGLAGAVLDSPKATANLIVDGIHLHPAIVKMVYRLKGRERVVLVTDAMAGLGMAPGRYVLAGQEVIVDETSARLADSPKTLAGSILTLNAAIRNMIAFTGCPAHEAVAMATLNPARLLGLEDRFGRLEPGYAADVAVFTTDFEPLLTLVAGRKAFGDIAL